MTREVIWRWVTPRWRRHLEALVERERPDAVIVFTVPMAHLRGIPTTLRERFGMPVVFYDGDAPMSLPEFGGMDTGFNWYHDADPSEYDLAALELRGRVRAAARARVRGAPRPCSGAPIPTSSRPRPVDKEVDVFFYGYGDKFRREWVQAMVGEPSRRLPDVDFALGGRDFQGDIGAARVLGDVPFNAFSRAISAARINLCITRRSHAGVYASSSCRPFELPSSGAAIVSNPYAGIERWFEPGSELIVVEDADDAVAAYRELLADPGQAEELGRRARERVLDEHTYRHRARQVLGCRRSRSARVKKLAIVPAFNEEAAIGGVVDEHPRLRPVVRRRRDRRRVVRPHRREAAARRGARSCRAAVQPGHRRRRADRVPLRVRAAGTTSSCASTATASTIRRELSKLLAPVGRERPTSAWLAVRGRGRAPASVRAARRHPHPRADRLAAHGQRVTDTTSGFQALNRRAIALFAHDYPHDYPRWRRP